MSLFELTHVAPTVATWPREGATQRTVGKSSLPPRLASLDSDICQARGTPGKVCVNHKANSIASSTAPHKLREELGRVC
eukprot:2559038-Heterocapsa_arctica.AAC.1